MWHFVRFSTPYDMRVNESLFLGSCQNGKRVIWDCPKVFPGFIKAFHNECEGSSFNCPVTKERRDYAEKAINAFLPRQKSNKKATVFFLKVYHMVTVFESNWKLVICAKVSVEKRCEIVSWGKFNFKFSPKLWFSHGFTVFENHRKSIIQHCERSELCLHF